MPGFGGCPGARHPDVDIQENRDIAGGVQATRGEFHEVRGVICKHTHEALGDTRRLLNYAIEHRSHRRIRKQHINIATLLNRGVEDQGELVGGRALECGDTCVQQELHDASLLDGLDVRPPPACPRKSKHGRDVVGDSIQIDGQHGCHQRGEDLVHRCKDVPPCERAAAGSCRRHAFQCTGRIGLSDTLARMSTATQNVLATYPLKTGWKVFFWIFGVLTVPMFFVGVPVVMLALKAELRVTNEGLQWWWLGTRTAPWHGTFVQKVAGANLLARLMGPLRLQVDGKNLALPLGTFEGEHEVAQLLRDRAGADI